MGIHNNSIGRDIAGEIKKDYGDKWYAFSPEDKDNIIAERVWEKMKTGKVILDPSGRTKLKNVSEQQYIESVPTQTWNKHGDLIKVKSTKKESMCKSLPAWDKHGNLTGMAADINDLGAGVNGNNTVEYDGTKNINPLDKVNTDGSGSDFKINTFDILKKDNPYINNINSINKTEQNKNTLFPNIKQNNNSTFTPTFTPTPTPTFNDLLKKSSVLNNNVSIDNQDLIAKNSTFGGVDNGFLNEIKGKRFQDLSDEERLKAIWHFVG